jgi:hypothetical protein
MQGCLWNSAELINLITNTLTVGNQKIGAYLSFLLVKKAGGHASQEQQYSLNEGLTSINLIIFLFTVMGLSNCDCNSLNKFSYFYIESGSTFEK